MPRLRALCRSALLVALLTAGAALAKGDAKDSSCEARCANDQKNCEVQCVRKAGKHSAQCKPSCSQLVAPCFDVCKSKGKK